MAADENEVIGEKLTVRQLAFCENYSDPDSPGVNNASESARLAGYSPTCIASITGKLMSDLKILHHIRELQEQHRLRMSVSASSLVVEYRRDRDAARKKGDYATAKACTDSEARVLGFWTDRTIITSEEVDEQKHLGEKERAELEELANLRLRRIG